MALKQNIKHEHQHARPAAAMLTSRSQQESDNINKKNIYKHISKINNNADIKSHQRIDNMICIKTLDGRKVINSTNVHIIHHVNRAQSHNMSDNTTSIITYNIASEFGIDTMIGNMQESFTKSSYIKLKNIIEENAQDISDHTLHIKNCWKIYYIKSIDNINLIEQKYYNKNWFIKADSIQ